MIQVLATLIHHAGWQLPGWHKQSLHSKEKYEDYKRISTKWNSKPQPPDMESCTLPLTLVAPLQWSALHFCTKKLTKTAKYCMYIIYIPDSSVKASVKRVNWTEISLKANTGSWQYTGATPISWWGHKKIWCLPNILYNQTQRLQACVKGT